MMNNRLLYFPEPSLTFGFDQKTADPRDGLSLFGPYQGLPAFSIRAGVVGTKEGLVAYSQFVQKMNAPMFSTKNIYGKVKPDEIARPNFPGFESVFGIQWPTNPEASCLVDSNNIERILKKQKNKKIRTKDLVELYIQEVKAVYNKEDATIDVWFIVVPRNLYFGCKTGSEGRDFSSGTKAFLDQAKAGQASILFPGEENYIEELGKLVDSTSDFHHLLKARLIQERINIPIQIILESTLNFRDKYKNTSFDDNMKCHLAWTQSATLYYKLGKLPWKLGEIRDNVCYVGLIFKRTSKLNDKRSVCSAAQMFLRDGDGSVFRGNIGLWQSENEKEYHLDETSAEQLIGMALDDFKGKKGKYPDELFIHGRARFSDKEWSGFNVACRNRGASTNLVGVVIKDSNNFKLFRDAENSNNNYGVLRGMAFSLSESEGYLMTRGFIPRLNTATSLEIPNPLHIQVTRGNSDIGVVMQDVLALTKLNYNACIYGDGLPVTLRFSDVIGNILTATDDWKSDQRQFKFYI